MEYNRTTTLSQGYVDLRASVIYKTSYVGVTYLVLLSIIVTYNIYVAFIRIYYKHLSFGYILAYF